VKKVELMKKCRVGYINTKGEWVVHPQLRGGSFFRGELNPVSIAIDTGFIDIYGQQIIAPDSSAPHDSYLHGYYLDRTGRIVVTPKVCAEGEHAGYKIAEGTHNRGFSDGLALTQEDASYGEWVQYSGRYGYVNLTGDLAIGFLYADARRFSEGLAAVKFENSDEYGFIDRNGELVITPQFHDTFGFHEGLSGVVYKPTVPKSNLYLYTYVNRQGKLIAEPQFTSCYDVSEGRCIVREGSEYVFGCLDTEGRCIVKPQFQWMGRYAEGLSHTAHDNREWGFLDLAGNVAIPFQFEDVTPFHAGLAGAMLNGKWGFIDRHGDFVIEPRYDALHNFEFSSSEDQENIGCRPDIYENATDIGFFDGLARVVMDGKYFYIDTTGELLTPQGFEKAHRFSNGKALVSPGLGENWSPGFIDTHGQIEYLHIPQEYNGLPVYFDKYCYGELYNPFYEGLMAVWTIEELPEKVKTIEKRRVGCINTKGEWVVYPQLGGVGLFQEGLAPVIIAADTGFTDIYGQQLIAPDSSEPHDSCLYGYYLDQTGQIVITPKVCVEGKYAGYAVDGKYHYDYFSEGLAATRAGTTYGKGGKYFGRYGYISLTGDLVIGFLYTEAREFSEGFAAVQLELDGKYGFVDRQGEMVIAPQFDDVFRFQGGLAKVEYKPNDSELDISLYTYVNRQGKLITEPQFIYCSDVSEGRCIVAEGSKYVSDSFNSEYLFGCLDTEGRWIVKPQFQCMGRYAGGLSHTARDDEWGFIDLAGKVVIPFQFEDVTPFREGLAGAMLNGKWGFIDRSGDFVIEPRYDALNNLDTSSEYPENIGGRHSDFDGGDIGFSDGLARVVIDGKYFYIDTKGELLTPQGFEKAHRFSNGKALVSPGFGENWHPGFIDTHGQIEYLHIPQEYNGLPVHYETKYFPGELDDPFSEGLMTVWTIEELPVKEEDTEAEIDDEEFYDRGAIIWKSERRPRENTEIDDEE
jgi:hypothetical protein